MKEPIIAGIMQLTEFPLSPVMAINFSNHVNHLVLGFEPKHPVYGNAEYVTAEEWHELFKRIKPFPENVTVDMFTNPDYQNQFGNETMLRRLDDIKPDVVLQCDSDTTFDYGNGFEQDFKEFWEGDYDILIFRSKCETVDNRYAPDFPHVDHCRAMKWFPGLTYDGANTGGFCVPHHPDSMGHWKAYYAKYSHEIHLPLYTKKLEDERWKYYGEDLTRRTYEGDMRDRQWDGQRPIPRPDRIEKVTSDHPSCPYTTNVQQKWMQTEEYISNNPSKFALKKKKNN